jgi:LL-diaminopimelate aminotransferase
LQTLFGSKVSIAVQDPAYPVYVDGSILHGIESIHYLPCTPENNFFPTLDSSKKTDLLYFCSPNNPTGAVATKEQLKRLVAFAREQKSILIFDSAYAHFVQDPTLPSSIYEIEGADEVAIETGSFSKIAGFTGVRLGWTIVPKKIKYEDGLSVHSDWRRLTSTIFNGACNIAQYGGVAILSDSGQKEIENLTKFYMENTRILKNALRGSHYTVYGGDHAPYVWIHFKGKTSWGTFQEILETHHLVTTPGVGFGPCGEGFIRISAFGHRHNILKAAERLAHL